MDWKERVETITFFYKMLRHCPSVGYEVFKISESKVAFRLVFDNDLLTHELDLTGEVDWPPLCAKDLETLQVNSRIEEEILFNMLTV